MSYRANLDDKKKLIFIHIPKCAGMSVRDWYSNVFKKFNIKNHAPISCYNTSNSIVWTITRNPYDRAISWYNFRGQIIQKRKNKAYKDEIPYWNKGIDYWIHYYFDTYWYDHKNSNNMYGPDNNYFKLSTPQVAWLKTNNNLDENLIKIKLEDITTDFLHIKKICKTNVNLGKLNKSKIKNKFSLKDSTKKIIEDFYKEDFELLGY